MDQGSYYHFKQVTDFINMGYVQRQELHADRTLPFWVLGIITSGSILITVGDEAIEALQNEYYLLPPNIRHFGARKSPFDVIYFHFNAEFERIKEFSKDKIVLPLHGKTPLSINYGSIQSFLKHAIISDVVHPLMIRSQIEAVLIQLSIENSIKNLSADWSWSLVQNINHYLTSYYQNEISHELLEKEFCYSYVHLNRIYKKHMKDSIFKQLETIRIKAAEEQILLGHLIKNIAVEVGYEDYYYFLKKFKKITGFTPKEYYRNYSIK